MIIIVHRSSIISIHIPPYARKGPTGSSDVAIYADIGVGFAANTNTPHDTSAAWHFPRRPIALSIIGVIFFGTPSSTMDRAHCGFLTNLQEATEGCWLYQ